MRQLAATLSKRFTAPRRALGALGEWNSQAVDGFRSALWQALASGPEPPVARALCVAVAEEASDATQPWPAASSNCVAGLGAAPGSPQATVALTLCAVGDRRPSPFDRRAADGVEVMARWRAMACAIAGRDHTTQRAMALRRHHARATQALADGDDAKVGLAGDASISEVIAPLQQHLSSDAETGVLAVKAACTLAIRCSSAARKQVLAPSLAKAVLQATQVFLTKDESKGVECLDALVDAAGEGARVSRRRRRSIIGVGRRGGERGPVRARDAFPSARGRSGARGGGAGRRAAARQRCGHERHPRGRWIVENPGRDLPEEWAAQPCPLLALADCDDEGEHVRGGDQALRRLAAT